MPMSRLLSKRRLWIFTVYIFVCYLQYVYQKYSINKSKIFHFKRLIRLSPRRKAVE